MDQSKLKTCGKCSRELPLDSYRPTPTGQRRSPCIECHDKMAAQNRQAWLEGRRAAQRRWLKNHPEQARELARDSAWRRYQRNPSPRRERNLQWAKKNRKKIRERLRLSRFGVGREWVARTLASQGSGCAICRRAKPTKIGWCVDHDHATGRLRGVLCSSCNTAIGQLQDSAVNLASGAEYLIRHSAAVIPSEYTPRIDEYEFGMF